MLLTFQFDPLYEKATNKLTVIVLYTLSYLAADMAFLMA